MAVTYVRTFTTTCPGALIDAINDNINISPVLIQITNEGGPGDSTFYFDVALSGPEVTEFDGVLGSWVCPPPPDAGSEDVEYDDAAGPDPDVIWSSDKIQSELDNLVLGDPDQNLFETITGDSGSTTANTTTDTLNVVGGTGISTSITGDTLTITNDSPNVDQNIFETINADTGSTTANTTTDTLTFAGGAGIDTSISGDTVTHTLNATLEELNNVSGSPAAVDGNVLTFDGTAGTWQAQAPATFVSLEAFDAYFTTGTVNINAGWTDVPLNVQRQITGAFTHSTPDAAVSINTTDKYLVIGRVTTENTGGGSRSESTARLVVDTGTGFVEVPGTLGWNYNRNSNEGTTTATIQAILDLAAGDDIKLQAQRSGGSDDIELDPNGCALTIISLKGLKGDKGDTGDPGPSGAPSIALVQARRSTTLTVPTTWSDLSFNLTDAESDSSIIEHNNPTFSDRITVKEDGWYQVYYHVTVDDETQARVRINDTTIVPGSDQEAGEVFDANDVIIQCTATTFVELNANDFLTVQLQARTTAETLLNDALFSVYKLEGVVGPQGPPGADGEGQSVEIQDNDATVVNPVQILNFEGDLTVVDEGSGKVTINVNAPDTLPKFFFPADTFDNPFASDWAVSDLAPAAIDTNSNAIVVRRFDDTTEEGVGFTIPIPTGATQFTLKIKSRAETGPVSAQTVVPKLYYRTITDNGAITSWSSTVLTAVNIPTNEFYQYDEQTLSLTGIASPNDLVQFEFTRDTTSASDTLTGDWDLLSLEIEFG